MAYDGASAEANVIVQLPKERQKERVLHQDELRHWSVKGSLEERTKSSLCGPRTIYDVKFIRNVENSP